MALINCGECNKEISDQAAACPHCGISINDTRVTIDPFAQLRTPIQGKSKGKLTILGKIGVFFLGPFLLFSAGLVLIQAKQLEQPGLAGQGILTIVFAAAVMIGSWLWARK